MRIDNFDSLFKCVYNARFWISVGLRNKRAGETLENEEKEWLEGYVDDISDMITMKREHVSSYMREHYDDLIERLNNTDKEETSIRILEKRREQKEKEALEEAIGRFSIQQVPWVYHIETTPSVNTQDIVREMYQKTPDHFGVIRSICMVHQEEESSKEILKYLDEQGF